MQTVLPLRLLVGFAAVCALALACTPGSPARTGSGSTRAPTTSAVVPAAGGNPFAPVLATSELTVGPNRFALGIVDAKTNQPVPDARVHFRFFTLQGDQGTLRAEADAVFVAPARDAGVPPLVQHVHADGSIHPHANVEADVGVYVARVPFEQPGRWGVEATFRLPDGRDGRVTAAFEVAAKSTSPAIGAPAPRTRNLTARDVKDLSEISTAAEPLPALYQTTVADAIAAGRPALVAFVTPGYCQTRFCGPMYELVKRLVPKYGDRAALIHIEIWKDPLKKVPFEAVTEWNLRSEPYIFILDRKGVIVDKFEGSASLAELDEALAAVTRG